MDLYFGDGCVSSAVSLLNSIYFMVCWLTPLKHDTIIFVSRCLAAFCFWNLSSRTQVSIVTGQIMTAGNYKITIATERYT